MISHSLGCPWIKGYSCICGPSSGENICPHGTRSTLKCYKCEIEQYGQKTTACETTKDRIGDYKTRKQRPLCTGVLDYFPDALLEVAHCSWVGNEQHNPGQKLHWAKEKSIGEGNEILRHLIDRGTRDSDGVRHLAKAAWRCLELLQREIDAEKKSPWLTEKDRT